MRRGEGNQSHMGGQGKGSRSDNAGSGRASVGTGAVDKGRRAPWGIGGLGFGGKGSGIITLCVEIKDLHETLLISPGINIKRKKCKRGSPSTAMTSAREPYAMTCCGVPCTFDARAWSRTPTPSFSWDAFREGGGKGGGEEGADSAETGGSLQQDRATSARPPVGYSGIMTGVDSSVRSMVREKPAEQCQIVPPLRCPSSALPLLWSPA